MWGAHEASWGLVGWWESLYLSPGFREDKNSRGNRQEGSYQQGRRENSESNIVYTWSVALTCTVGEMESTFPL